jgi:hypothetical protein
VIAAICSLTRLLQAGLAVVAGSISAGMDGRDIKEITGFREESLHAKVWRVMFANYVAGK